MKLMSTKDAAKHLEVSERTIFRLIERKLIKAEKFGNYWAIDPESVEAYKEQIEGKSKFNPTRGKAE
jgi:excisionase family DNA binding protein